MCPFGQDSEGGIGKMAFKRGFLTATYWWFMHEKQRHLKNIEEIDKDLLKLSKKVKCDVKDIDVFIDIE